MTTGNSNRDAPSVPGDMAPERTGNGAATASRDRVDRAHGLVLGAAIGDALGAPFEFGPPGAFSERFSRGSGELEMVGGNGWDPGEFTDDTQMAILEANSIIEAGQIDEAVIFSNFRLWAESGPKDIGVSTHRVLSDPRGWPDAPEEFYTSNPDSAAGNGSLMRAGFAAARWAFANNTGTAAIARRLSAITHADPAAGEGRALFHMLVHEALVFNDPFESLSSMLACIKDDQRDAYVEMLGAEPPTIPGNGSVWGCLRDAVLAVRTTDSFEDCMRAACDVGNDVDTVAAVAGGLAGAIYGVDAIPERWVDKLHGHVLGTIYDAEALVELCDRLMALRLPKVTSTAYDGGTWLTDR